MEICLKVEIIPPSFQTSQQKKWRKITEIKENHRKITDDNAVVHDD
jgi:hypothetical protein